MTTQPPFNPQFHQYQPQAPQKKKRGRTVAVVVGVVAALSVGYGIGSTETAEPVTKTETKTVTETETETVEATPTACIDALDAADQVRKDARKFADSMVEISEVHQKWPRLVIKAARAGANLDTVAIGEVTAAVESITEDVQGVNADLDELATETGEDVDAYQIAAAQCRASS